MFISEKIKAGVIEILFFISNKKNTLKLLNTLGY